MTGNIKDNDVISSSCGLLGWTLKRCDQAYSTEAYSNNHRKLWHKTLEINPDPWCTVLCWNVIQPLHHVAFPPRNVHAYPYSHIIKCLCYSYWNRFSNYCSQWNFMVISILKRTFESVSEWRDQILFYMYIYLEICNYQLVSLVPYLIFTI